MSIMSPQAAQSMASRADAARAHLRHQLTSRIPMDDATADLVTDYYVKHRLATLDKYMGTASVKHGALLDDYAIAAAIIITTPIA